MTHEEAGVPPVSRPSSRTEERKFRMCVALFPRGKFPGSLACLPSVCGRLLPNLLGVRAPLGSGLVVWPRRPGLCPSGSVFLPCFFDATSHVQSGLSVERPGRHTYDMILWTWDWLLGSGSFLLFISTSSLSFSSSSLLAPSGAVHLCSPRRHTLSVLVSTRSASAANHLWTFSTRCVSVDLHLLSSISRVAWALRPCTGCSARSTECLTTKACRTLRKSLRTSVHSSAPEGHWVCCPVWDG